MNQKSTPNSDDDWAKAAAAAKDLPPVGQSFSVGCGAGKTETAPVLTLVNTMNQKSTPNSDVDWAKAAAAAKDLPPVGQLFSVGCGSGKTETTAIFLARWLSKTQPADRSAP